VSGAPGVMLRHELRQGFRTAPAFKLSRIAAPKIKQPPHVAMAFRGGAVRRLATSGRLFSAAVFSELCEYLRVTGVARITWQAWAGPVTH
jgi:hypothetical protein